MSIFGFMTKKETAAAIEEAVKAALLESVPRWLAETADTYRLRMPDPSVYGNQADLYRKLSWVLSACEITAQFAATAKFSVSRIIADREPRDIPNHPFEMLLRKPNPLDGRFSFLVASFISYKLTGNCYWWMNKPTPDSPPDELWFIPSHMIIPIPDKQMYVSGYYYYPENGKEMILPPEEILHVRRFNPANRFVGLSAIESIAQVATGDLHMQEWNTNLFGDGNGQLRGVLAFADMINDETWRKLKNDMRESSRRREHMLLRGVGANGVNWMQNAVSQKEMEFLSGRDFNKEEIWTVLAPGLYSMLSENATEANSRTGQSAFKDFSIFPMHTLWNEEITNKILPLYGSSNSRPLVGAFEDVRGEDRELKIKEIETFAKFHPINEVRETYYNAEPIGDERGELLVAQIKPESGGIQEPPMPSKPVPGASKPETSKNPSKDDDDASKGDASKPTRAQKAVLELNTWQRKAVKSVGKRVEFEVADVPENIAAYVNQFLPGCNSNSAVKSVFDNARRMVDPEAHREPAPEPVQPNSEAITKLADVLNGYASAAKAENMRLERVEGMFEAIKGMFAGRDTPSQIFNFPEIPVTVNTPKQDAPVSNVYLSPTVAAAKAPDVRVDSPVHIHNSVDPATAVVNIENKMPDTGAPVINIENRMPDQPAPEVAVKNEFVLPEQMPPIVNVSVQPTPVEVKNDVTVQPAPVENNITVKTPKVKRTKARPERGPDGLIDSNTTDYEYEGE
jgi:HK97 family phage portal protein